MTSALTFSSLAVPTAVTPPSHWTVREPAAGRKRAVLIGDCADFAQELDFWSTPSPFGPVSPRAGAVVPSTAAAHTATAKAAVRSAAVAWSAAAGGAATSHGARPDPAAPGVLTREMVQSVLHMPQIEAAKACGHGLTMVRELQICLVASPPTRLTVQTSMPSTRDRPLAGAQAEEHAARDCCLR